MIIAKNIEDARKQIDKLSKESKKITVLGGDDDFNRKILEMKKVSILLSPEHGHSHDSLKQRDSGLNHVLCNLAKENNIAIGINFNNLNKERIELVKWLGRIMQNIKLCRKAGVRIMLFNNNMSKNETRSFLLSLGMSTEQAKETIDASQ